LVGVIRMVLSEQKPNDCRAAAGAWKHRSSDARRPPLSNTG
jgi:hypothetical protein